MNTHLCSFLHCQSHRKSARPEMACCEGSSNPFPGTSLFAGLAWLLETLVISLKSPGISDQLCRWFSALSWEGLTPLLNLFCHCVSSCPHRAISGSVPRGWVGAEAHVFPKTPLQTHCTWREIGWFMSGFGFGGFSCLFSSMKVQMKILKFDVTAINHGGTFKCYLLEREFFFNF